MFNYQHDEGEKWQILMRGLRHTHTRIVGSLLLVAVLFFTGNFFLKAQGVDTSGPLITNITVSDLASDSARMNWTTNEEGFGWVEFKGTCPSSGCVTEEETVATTTHSVVVAGLTESTNYEFEVKTRDAAGNLSSSMQFVTLAQQSGTPTPPPPPGSQPDVVVIVTDDHRWDMFGPDILPITNQKIGDLGVRFENSFLTTPLCCPSRASILTGLYTHNHNAISVKDGTKLFQDNGWEQNNLAVWLQNAGYRTALFGKYLNQYNLVTPFPYVPPGWSEWGAFTAPGYKSYHLVEKSGDGPISTVSYGSSKYSTTVLADKSVSFIESTPADQQLFLYFNPYGPHDPYTAESSADTNKFPVDSTWRPPSFNEADASDKPVWITRLPLLTEAKQLEMDANYRAQKAALQSVDRAIGNVVDALERTGRLDNTVIVLLSDNGYMLGEHRIVESKDCAYEECVRTNMMIRAPGVTPRVESKFALNVDVPATIIDYVGLDSPLQMNGTSLRPLLHDPNIANWRDSVLLETLNPGHPFYAIRTSQYKYVNTSGQKELYDLAADPHELQNIASNPAYAQIIADLEAQLEALKAE